MGAAMTQQEHKLISTPVSVADGMKRGDGRTWFVLLIAAAVAIAVVVLINLFVEKPNIRWPSSAPQAQPAAAPADDEPKTYEVAPPATAPATPNRD